MSKQHITHMGFSDESNWNKGRFRSIGLVTCPVSCLNTINDMINKLLKEHGVSELQWKELNGGNKRETAKKICEFVIDFANNYRKLNNWSVNQQRLNEFFDLNSSSASADDPMPCLRIDILIWDISDSRHNIKKRDDIENLQRMYYHLFHNVMRKRWPSDAIWRFHPDKHTAIDWMTVKECLNNTTHTTRVSTDSSGNFRFQLQREFNIEEIVPVDSEEHPALLQIADLFAGLAIFSRDKFSEYIKWTRKSHGQKLLISDEENNESNGDPSNKDRERFKVLDHFYKICNENKIGVSLKEKSGLWTPNPGYPINFWMYEPQHENDKAPQKA